MEKRKIIKIAKIGVIILTLCLALGALFPMGVDGSVVWVFNRPTHAIHFFALPKSNGIMEDHYYRDEPDEGPSPNAPWYKYLEQCRAVCFGKGIKKIGDSACNKYLENYNGKTFSKVKMESTIESIGEYAFAHCECLHTINLPKNLEIIEKMAFYESGLENVTVNKRLKSIGEYAFGRVELASISLPDSVECIEEGAFFGSLLKEFTFPPKITKVKKNVLCECKLLKKVVMQNCVEVIEEYAFSGNASLVELIIPKSVKKLGRDIVENSMSLKHLRIESTKLSDVDSEAFSGMNPNVTVEVPKEKYEEYRKMLYNCGLPKTAKVVAY